MIERALREALAANDLTLWSKSGAHVFNSETAIRDLAHSIEVRLPASPAPATEPLAHIGQLAIDWFRTTNTPDRREADAYQRLIDAIRVYHGPHPSGPWTGDPGDYDGDEGR